MTRRLRAWGVGSPQKRTLVCAATRIDALRLLNTATGGRMSMYEFSGWWAETRNAQEVATATELGVWQNPQGDQRNGSKRWERLL